MLQATNSALTAEILEYGDREREMELEAGNAEDACMLGFARNSALLT